MKNAETDRTGIVARLKHAREHAGLSQGQAAKLLKMHRPTISEIEAGRRRVSAEELDQFAKLYDVELDWLARGDSSSTKPDKDRLQLAARELSKLKPDDLKRVIELLSALRKPEADR